MRFKVKFSDRGVRVLEKLFLPTLEKFGKTCQLLLSPSEVYLIQTTTNTDGPHVLARFDVGVLFDEQSYVIESKHYNLVAFQLDIPLLLRVLKGNASNGADLVETKLAVRSVPAPDGLSQQSRPFLVFMGKGASMALTQDLPISKPYPPRDIDRLVAAKDSSALCPFYLDLLAATARLQAVVERMRSLGQVVRLAACKCGDLHLQVAATNVVLGCHITGLDAYGAALEQAPPAPPDRQLGAREQLLAALDSGDAVEVHLQVKHLARVLQVIQVTTPAQVLCGIAEDGGYVHVMFVYRDPGNPQQAYDDQFNLGFKLPVREDC